MKNTFRYSLTEQDYIIFEKFNFKRIYKPILILVIMAITGFSIYYYCKFKLPIYIVAGILFLLGSLAVFYNRYTDGINNKVRRYVQNDKSYLKQVEISIDRKGIELNTLSNEGDVQINVIYPYSIMNVIFETDDFLYFIIDSEAKILPKSVIPNEMHGEVLRLIKKNKKRMYVK